MQQLSEPHQSELQWIRETIARYKTLNDQLFAHARAGTEMPNSEHQEMERLRFIFTGDSVERLFGMIDRLLDTE